MSRVARPRRKMSLTLTDILKIVQTQSFGGHPDDYIGDEDYPEIKLTCSRTQSPRIVIEWDDYS